MLQQEEIPKEVVSLIKELFMRQMTIEERVPKGNPATVERALTFFYGNKGERELNLTFMRDIAMMLYGAMLFQESSNKQIRVFFQINCRSLFELNGASNVSRDDLYRLEEIIIKALRAAQREEGKE